MAKIPVDFSQFEELEVSKADRASRTWLAGMADLLNSRAKMLTGKDKALMKMYLDGKVSFRQMSRISSVTESSIRRRVGRLIKGLLGEEFVICIKYRQRLGKKELDIARDYYVAGLSQKKMAAKNKCTMYFVKKSVSNIRQLVDEVRTEEAGSRRRRDVCV